MKEIFVVGNGASLKGFDWTYLKDKEWVGLTLAYRHWNRNKIYPNHYINIDAVVIKNNIKDIMKLIKEKRCQNYILCKSVLKYCPEIKEFYNPNGESPVKFIQDLYKISGGLSPFRYLVSRCSGSVAVMWAYMLAPDSINILGCDCKYTEAIPECIQLPDGTLKIIEPVKNNPNYFIDDYQRIGDIYNVPNTQSVHLVSWFDTRNIILLYNIIHQKEIKIFNYNSVKTLEDFFETHDIEKLENYDSHN